MEDRLAATELWFLRRIQNISWIKHITNKEVLQRSRQQRQLLDVIIRRQLQFLGHILRSKMLSKEISKDIKLEEDKE